MAVLRDRGRTCLPQSARPVRLPLTVRPRLELSYRTVTGRREERRPDGRRQGQREVAAGVPGGAGLVLDVPGPSVGRNTAKSVVPLPSAQVGVGQAERPPPLVERRSGR